MTIADYSGKAAAIVDDAPGEEGGAAGRLASEDRMVLTRVRESVARWLSFVDRMTPAEPASLTHRGPSKYILGATRHHVQIRQRAERPRGSRLRPSTARASSPVAA